MTQGLEGLGLHHSTSQRWTLGGHSPKPAWQRLVSLCEELHGDPCGYFQKLLVSGSSSKTEDYCF